MKMKCEDCTFWVQGEDARELSRGFGECRLSPPAIMDSAPRGKWPTTKREQWCGKYQPKGYAHPTD